MAVVGMCKEWREKAEIEFKLVAAPKWFLFFVYFYIVCDCLALIPYYFEWVCYIATVQLH